MYITTWIINKHIRRIIKSIKILVFYQFLFLLNSNLILKVYWLLFGSRVLSSRFFAYCLINGWWSICILYLWLVTTSGIESNFFGVWVWIRFHGIILSRIEGSRFVIIWTIREGLRCVGDRIYLGSGQMQVESILYR